MKGSRKSEVGSRRWANCATGFRTSFRDPRGSRAGFTLIELLIVIGLIAILAAVVIPAVQGAGSEGLESTARIVAADLRLARSQAIAFNTHYTVLFDSTANSYQLLHTGAGTPPPLVNLLAAPGSTPGVYAVDLDTVGSTTPQPSAAKFTSAELSQSGTAVSEVRFSPTGGTGPERTDDTVVWITSGSGSGRRAIPVTVSWVTGNVWVGSPQILPGS